MDKLEPFSYSELAPFEMPYLAGYLAEQYNYDDKELLPRVTERVKRYASQYLASTITGYSTVTYNHKDIRLNPLYTASGLDGLLRLSRQRTYLCDERPDRQDCRETAALKQEDCPVVYGYQRGSLCGYASGFYVPGLGGG